MFRWISKLSQLFRRLREETERDNNYSRAAQQKLDAKFADYDERKKQSED